MAGRLQNRFVGIVLVAVSAASFGTLAISGRYAFADGMDAPTIMFLRFSLGAVVMACLLCARGERLPHGAILLRLTGMGAIGYVGQAFCYLTALKYASAGLVALLLYLYPIFVAILSAVVMKERITGAKRVALGLGLAGTVLTVGPEGGRWIGVLLAISAAAIYSGYILIGVRVMAQVSAVQASVVIFAAAAMMSGVLMAVHGPHLPATGAGWAAIAAIVGLATVVAVTTFLAGMERIGATSAATISTLEPVVTVLLAAWLLHERLRPSALLGGGLILAAGLLITHGELRGKESTLGDRP